MANMYMEYVSFKNHFKNDIEKYNLNVKYNNEYNSLSITDNEKKTMYMILNDEGKYDIKFNLSGIKHSLDNLDNISLDNIPNSFQNILLDEFILDGEMPPNSIKNTKDTKSCISIDY